MRGKRYWFIVRLRTHSILGKPKPIVHRAGGMLLQLAKELVICGDFTPNDVFLYYTTTGSILLVFPRQSIFDHSIRLDDVELPCVCPTNRGNARALRRQPS